MRIRTAFVAGLLAVALLGTDGLPAQQSGSRYEPRTLTEQAPKKFKINFETSKGSFEVLVKREWSPLGADRLYNLVRSGFYNGVRFFRVVDGFVAQFGISGDPVVSRAWQSATIEDDPVVQTNKRGMVSFAKAGKNSRTTQLFINLVDNTRLDQLGFSPVGKVTKGMEEVVDRLYSGYGEKLTKDQYKIVAGGNSFLNKSFPHLDYILTATIID
jgi:peptidyl-prolyl cis-trans isomerase A (cyclophilin A)